MKDIINILPENVANQIAAGEVVQRPASVVKELLENSIDADAKEIKILIKDAGKTMIQVIDNGVGMSKRDVLICFDRHTTSKISDAKDLFNIKSKGFRGEALASISAISHVNLISKQSGVELANEIEIHGSEIKSNKSTVSEVGTKISVKNLFFNIPARRNFLKSNNVELKHIVTEFIRVALAHPDVKLIFYNDDSEMYNLPVSNFKKRIVNLFGVKSSEKLVPVSENTEILNVYGFIFKPQYSKKTRGEQFFFVNNRFIKSPYLNHAINSAFEGLIDPKYNPSYFLNLEVDPASIDINIHPTKTEIKFEDEHSIYAILRASVKHSLGQYNITPVLDFNRDKSLDIPYHFEKNGNSSSIGIDINTNYNPFDENKSGEKYVEINSFKEKMDSLEFLSESNELKEFNFEDFESSVHLSNPIQLNKKFIVNKTKSGLIIINQERAHQRILYERFLKSLTLNKVNPQKLLHPIVIDFSKFDIETLKSNKNILNQFGLDFDLEFEKININAAPSFINIDNLKEIFENLIYNIQNEIPDNSFSESDLICKIMSKSVSIRNGKSLDLKEQQYIINSLFACKETTICPFNLKTYVQINYSEIENMFK
jgi:DNA mismatch repair protein MutL